MVYDQVEIVPLDERMFIGIPVTSSFQNHDPGRIEEAKALFLKRRHEITNAIHTERYVCPHFDSETLFTYLFCMEVSRLDNVPEGMIGFKVPGRRYAKTRSEQDPYETIHRFLKQRGLENDPNSISLEVYSFESPVWPGEVDVYVPIKETGK